jgi:hypothetical protein
MTVSEMADGAIKLDRAALPRSVELLHAARDLVVAEFGQDDPMSQAAMHLINCAADVVISLPGRDLETAREALASARAATGIAGYVVCRLGDDLRAGYRR